MANVEFFKQQAKNLFKDYNTRVYNEDGGYYAYSPRFFHDIRDILRSFEIDEKDGSFTLMKAQHIIAKLAGFNKWTELISASGPILEIGRLLILNRDTYLKKIGIVTNIVTVIVDEWKSYQNEYLADCSDETKLKVFKRQFLEEDEIDVDDNLVITLDLSNSEQQQDMVYTMMKDKKLSPDKAILSSINKRNILEILAIDNTFTAVGLWGHFDPNYKFTKLENPKVSLSLNQQDLFLIAIISKQLRVTFRDAILCFMICELEALGYDI